jgi:hypothetical protein
MQSLHRLAALWNSNTFLPTANLQTASLQEYYERLVLEEEEKKFPLRMSNMGKPLLELAQLVKKYKYGIVNTPPSRADLFRASVGVWCEALLVSMAKDAGLGVTRCQEEVTIPFGEAFTLIGHIDGVADGETIFDIKCISAKYYQKFSNQLDNERGYITQLALYQYATKMPKAAFFLVNSANGYAKVVPVPQRRLLDTLPDVRFKLGEFFTKEVEQIIKEHSPKQNRMTKYIS